MVQTTAGNHVIIETRNISKRSLLKIIIVGFGAGSLLLWLFVSFMSMYVSGSLTWDIESERGIGRFMDTLIIWPLFALLWASFTWLFLVLGLALVNRFSSLTLRTRD